MTDGSGENGPQGGPKTGSADKASPDDLAMRLDRLDAQLKVRKGADKSAPDETSAASGYARAMKMSTEFIGGIIVGAGLGWFIDRGLGTTPWGMIVFLLLGFCAGILNMLRAGGRVAEPKVHDPRDGTGRDKTKSGS